MKIPVRWPSHVRRIAGSQAAPHVAPQVARIRRSSPGTTQRLRRPCALCRTRDKALHLADLFHEITRGRGVRRPRCGPRLCLEGLFELLLLHWHGPLTTGGAGDRLPCRRIGGRRAEEDLVDPDVFLASRRRSSGWGGFPVRPPIDRPLQPRGDCRVAGESLEAEKSVCGRTGEAEVPRRPLRREYGDASAPER